MLRCCIGRVSAGESIPDDTIFSKTKFFLSADFPIYKLGKAKFPLRPASLPLRGNLFSLGTPCRFFQSEALTFSACCSIPICTNSFAIIFVSRAFKKSGSFLGTYLHYTTAGSCTPYDKNYSLRS